MKIPPEEFARVLRSLEQLRQFSGPPKTFWGNLLEALARLSGARFAVLLRLPGEPPWQRVGIWPPDTAPPAGSQAFIASLDTLSGAAGQNGEALQLFHSPSGISNRDCGIALRLETDSPTESWVAAFFLPATSQAEAVEALRELRLVSNVPLACQSQRAAAESQVKLTQFASVLDLMALLNAQHRFLAVALTLVNELAARLKCDRVSLGWMEGEYIRLQAISHTERFEKKMEAIRQLEQTMEEALDQNEVIVLPPAEDDTRISRDHAAFASAQKINFLCSVPLQLGGEVVGVVTCERNSEPFLEAEQRLLSLYTDMAVRRLSELKRNDRWFGARWALAARENLARLVGPEHTWAKIIAVLVALGLGILFFGRMNYRVEAPFIVRTDNVAILTAPFNGYIEEVPREIGDVVQTDDALLKLDTRDLLLEQAGAAAEHDRYTREAEKARAGRQLAEMRIAQAQADQAQVRLDLVRYHLEQAIIKAPFAGVIVEGDLKKRIGAPVKQGDALLKVGRTDRIYVECEVKESDIHEVRDDATGEIAFAGRPKLKFPVKLERIEPAAVTKEKDNVFTVRCQFDGPIEPWWRPGMSGVAKINVGSRTFFWVISHRTIDFLRLYFWV